MTNVATAAVNAEAPQLFIPAGWKGEGQPPLYTADQVAALRTQQPAPATQQVGERVYAFRRKGLDDFCTCDEARYEELSNKPHLFETRIFYTAPQPSPAAQGDALSDAVRVPLDSLHADAAYLIGRLREGSMPYARVIEIIRERIDAASPTAQAAESVPAPVLDSLALMKVVMQADEALLGRCTRGTTNWAAAIGKAVQDAVLAARAPEDSVLEDADSIRALIAQHAAILDQNESAYFELCYHRATGWMAWITDKPLCMPPVVNPDRKVLARGQGDTADEACRVAARKQGGAT